MKTTLISIVLLLANEINGQDIAKDNILNQGDNLIQNAYELLGKTEYEILSVGRPTLIVGGNMWRVTSKTPNENDDVSKFIHIETGTGSLITLYISKRTKKVCSVNLDPLIWVTFNEFNQHLKSKYTIDNDGYSSPIQTTNSEYVNFNLTMWDNGPYLVIKAIDPKTNKYRFE